MNTRLKSMVLVTSALIVCVASGTTSADLRAYWVLDETTGDAASDFSMNGFAGALLGGLSFDKDSVTGVCGHCLHLDGKDDCINGSSFELPTDAFTIALWFNPDLTLNAGSGRVDLVSWGTAEARGPCLIFNRRGRGKIGLYGEAHGEYDNVLSTTTSWSGSSWHHIAVTFADTIFKFYVNGRLENTIENDFASSHAYAVDVFFGVGAHGRYAFAGKLDEIQIYNHALTAEEVAQLQKPTLSLKEPVNAVMEARRLVRQEPKDAVVFIERKISEHEQRPSEYQAKHALVLQKVHFDLCFLLAKAKEAANASKKDVADAYCRTFDFADARCVSQQTAGLVWLLDNKCPNECRQIIKSCTQGHDVSEPLTSVIRNICKDCESTNNWPRLKQLLDALLAEAKPLYQWSVFVESCFDDKTTTSTKKKYHDYLENNDAYKLDRDHTLAKRHVANEEYEKAAQLYLSLLDRCGPADDKAPFEFKLYECMFLNGQYRDAIPKLEGYIASNKVINQSQVEEAMLMKARAHSQLGQLDEAVQSCSEVLKYPSAKQTPKARLFIGYYNMLHGRPKEATDVLNGVVRDYPESNWACKARLCLAQIQNMTEKGAAEDHRLQF